MEASTSQPNSEIAVSDTPEVNSLGFTQSERARPGKPLEAGKKSGTVRIRVRYPVDRFVSGVDNIVITAAGTEVPAGKVSALLDAAKAVDLQLEEF